MSLLINILFKAWKSLRMLVEGARNRVLFRIFRVSCEQFPRIDGVLFLRNSGILRIGRNVVINASHAAIPVGGFETTTLRVFPGGELVIGDGAGITNSVVCCAQRIEIGKHVFIGAGCRIYDTDFHSLRLEDRLEEAQGRPLKARTSPVRIREGAFLGSGTIVLKGVEIGERSIVGAGSVVSRSIPAGEIWGGNPARFLRALRPDELARPSEAGSP